MRAHCRSCYIFAKMTMGLHNWKLQLPVGNVGGWTPFRLSEAAGSMIPPAAWPRGLSNSQPEFQSRLESLHPNTRNPAEDNTSPLEPCHTKAIRNFASQKHWPVIALFSQIEFKPGCEEGTLVSTRHVPGPIRQRNVCFRIVDYISTTRVISTRLRFEGTMKAAAVP